MNSLLTEKIFVVDDDHFCLNIYQQYLESLGYKNVICFSNGTDCLNHLTEKPEVIFLDHGMDILNGVEVLKKIKRFDPDIYVVFISAQENIETAVNSLKYGAFDYIVKGESDFEKIKLVLDKIRSVKELLKRNKPSILKKVFSL